MPRLLASFWLHVALITLLGGILRFWNLDAAQFREDDWQITEVVYRIVHQGELPTGLGSSLNIAHGPAAAYIVAIPGLISTSHDVLAWWVALLNTAAIPLFAMLLRACFGTRAALLGAALFAANPWVVVTGRRLWLNSLLAPAAILFLWALYRAVESSKLRDWLVAGLALTASVQLHLASLANAIALLAATRSARSVRGPALAFIVAVVFALPWWVGSVQPALARINLVEIAAGGGAPSVEILDRATLTVTHGGYDAVTAPNATGPWFVLADFTARALALAGWLALVWIGVTQRRSRPPTAAVCLVAAAMVALPLAAGARPSGALALAHPGPHQLMNVVPPLTLGIAALTQLGSLSLCRLSTAAGGIIAALHVLAAIPLFMTIGEYWPESDYGIPWRSTGMLVATLHDRAAASDAFVFVGGDGKGEHQLMTARPLKLDYPLVRMHDGRDGLIFRTDRPRSVFGTTDDTHANARFLRGQFGSDEVLEQRLPGSGWTRRVFDVPTGELERWGGAFLRPVADPAGTGPLLRYEGAGLLPRLGGDGPPTLAILWGFQSDPVEAFFTEFRLLRGTETLHSEEHLAYPAPFMEADDWRPTRMLNLFDLPADLDLSQVNGVVAVHNGLRSGRNIAPAVRIWSR